MSRHVRRRPRRQTGWWIAVGIAGIAGMVWIAWTVLRPEPAATTEGMVTSLLGQPAPMLQLPDADGRVFAVPERGRATLLIFHMGLF